MHSHRSSAFLAAFLLLLTTFACRPVIAIGWSELLILLAIIAVLLGPLLLRIYRTLEALRRTREKPENKQKGG